MRFRSLSARRSPQSTSATTGVEAANTEADSTTPWIDSTKPRGTVEGTGTPTTIAPAPNPRNTGHGRLVPFQDFLVEMVQQDPDITLKELQGALVDAHGVQASLSGIDQVLKRLGYTYKKRALLRMSASAQK